MRVDPIRTRALAAARQPGTPIPAVDMSNLVQQLRLQLQRLIGVCLVEPGPLRGQLGTPTHSHFRSHGRVWLRV